MTMKVTLTNFAVLAIVAFGSACSTDHGKADGPQETVRNVPVLVAQRASVPDYLETVGTLRAVQTSQLASQIMGTVTNVAVREGDHVRRGQTLATIDENQQRAGVDRAQAGVTASQEEISAAEADYAFANATLNRYQGLFDKKSVSPYEFDEVKTRFAAAKARRDAALAGKVQAEAALVQARSSYGYTRIRAPFDGVVTAKLLDAGAMAAPGAPMFVVEDTRRFQLETTVDENALSVVRAGQSVPVSLDALNGREIPGKVVQIVPAADPASRTFLVKIEVPPFSDLHSGMFGRARFPRGQRNAIFIPQTAVLQRGQLRGVYVVDTNQVAGLRYITLGISSGEKFEVLSGLEDGERVVALPEDRELAGRRIEVGHGN